MMGRFGSLKLMQVVMISESVAPNDNALAWENLPLQKHSYLPIGPLSSEEPENSWCLSMLRRSLLC